MSLAETQRLRDYLLPASFIASGIVTSSWRMSRYVDTLENGPSGVPEIYVLIKRGQGAASPLYLYRWIGYTAITDFTYTWPGPTKTQGSHIINASGTVTQISIGDWVRKGKGFPLFRVSNVSGSQITVELELDNGAESTDLLLPGGTGLEKLEPMTELTAGLTTGGDFKFPNDANGGISRVWDDENIFVESLDAVPGGVQLSFRLYGTGSKQLELWYNTSVAPANTKGFMKDPSAGTLTGGGQTLTGLTADEGATLYTVTFDADAAGIDRSFGFTILPEVT